MCLTPRVSKYVTSWSPQHFRSSAEAVERDPAVIQNALTTANVVRSVNPALPPVFTLGHRLFRIQKRPSFDGERRFRVAELIPAMLSSFLDSDKSFARAGRERS
jgi:hypothetical protein